VTTAVLGDPAELPPAPADALVPSGAFRALLDAASDGIYSIDTTGVCCYVNPAAEQLLGYRAEELVGRSMHEVVHRTHHDGHPYPAAECPMSVAVSGIPPAASSTDTGFWRADGTFLAAEWRIQPVVVDGTLVGAVAKFSDVTRHRRADGALAGVLATSTDAICAIEEDGTVAAWNAAAEEMLGWTASEVIGRPVFGLMATDVTRPNPAGGLATLASRAGEAFPLAVKGLRMLRRDGGEAEVEAAVDRIPWAGGWRYQAFLRDVSALRRAESSLARSEAMYRLLVASSRDVISRHGASGELLFTSPAVEELSGWAPGDLVGRNLRDLVHPEDLDGLPGGVGDLGADGGEWTLRVLHRQGHWVWVESTSTVLRDDQGRVSEVLVCTRDITARRAREAASQQESKLESLGRLSAGLAHEINTPIQYVGDNARFLAEAFKDLMGLVALYRQTMTDQTAVPWADRLPVMRRAEEEMEIGYLETEVPSAVEQTLAGIDRVARIVRAMKTFSHQGHEEQEPADLNEALAATVTVTRHQVNQVADLELELGDLPPVRCNLADLNQVFLNLIVNAADAVEETGQRGTIRVRTVVDGGDVLIAVSDTGNGIPEDIREKVFDPFFTTKQVGRGTGQGLPLARSVVHEMHGGKLSLDTHPGAGTTLTVRLPIAGNPSTSERHAGGGAR
jgi:PAS domain S-box-containing protein